jgi:hypothetical protein
VKATVKRSNVPIRFNPIASRVLAVRCHDVYQMCQEPVRRSPNLTRRRAARRYAGTTKPTMLCVSVSARPHNPNHVAVVSRRRRAVVSRASGGGKKKNQQSLFNQVIDMLEGGKKLRRWYGSDSSVGDGSAERSGGEASDAPSGYGAEDADMDAEEETEDVELDLPRTRVAVTSADSTLGESIVMQLILAKVPVVAICEDNESAERTFGPYATFASDGWSPGARLNGVRSVVVTEECERDFIDACVRRGVKHIVLVSSAKSSSSGMFANGGEKIRRDRGREAMARASGLALTVIRPCDVAREPGGSKSIEFAQGDSISGQISMEDLAQVCARALTRPPKPGQTLEFEVRNAGAGSDRDWKALFAPLVV